ncbi:nucleotidyltransferase domain-containing protein [Micromonospora sp. FIMYZ51]|uniref:nucleotidyltransferase domain-containing protein n=1 Tax=Micromonospora sp. FIMYZ51 TaxID=3051832 RepID=UPI00311F4605
MKVDLDQCRRELTARALIPSDRIAVVIVGSVARGWANRGSDHDFYVITRTPWRRRGGVTTAVPLQPNQVAREALRVNGRRWELKYWLDRQVDQMLQKVSWARFEAGGSAAGPLSETEELFLERLFTCIPVEGADWVRRRRAELKESAFQAILVTRSLALSDACAEEALGQLADGDPPSAVLSARKALGHSVDALLESRGHYGSQLPKWRARRVREARLPMLPFERYWDYETMAGFDKDNPRPWIDSVILFCKQLSLEVEI